MKKSTILIVLGLFIVLTTFLGISTDKKMYQKEKHFETTSELLQQMENKSLRVIDEKGDFVESNDFEECFSERKRLTDLEFRYGKIEIQKIDDLSENQKERILQDYNTLREKFSKRRVITKEEVVRINVKSYDSYINQGKIIYDEPEKHKINLILIDEGEGLVIDYIMEYRADEVSEEGNQDA